MKFFRALYFNYEFQRKLDVEIANFPRSSPDHIDLAQLSAV